MLAIAMLIKLDSPGPVLFRQKRYGFNNQLIEVFKFRTMYTHMTDHNAEQLTRRNDPRITRLGAFLRRTSLDELPQFLNVLRGEMSIVGPRPHALSAKAGALLYQDAVKYYDARHRVKPGITGWAQVNGWRGETDTVEQIRKRVEHDLYYIEHWSIAPRPQDHRPHRHSADSPATTPSEVAASADALPVAHAGRSRAAP